MGSSLGLCVYSGVGMGVSIGLDRASIGLRRADSYLFCFKISVHVVSGF